ncbi:uncharacterized protein A4U43_C07F37580 [Asparagus officinalis]|uniref:Uncharacterized protein n=1 Tax=Asparagus officinalis TaxID=4686 RepID=A0A5P1EI81_ASPOF|nr:uncharacterized protein LOC109851092 [Asparagus officinalis]ONK65484.1 uncharacterized protein A4U43_C07F37580 [Asparagus officinalis]
MPQTREIRNESRDQIKIGATGTISSLMSRELESMKHSSHASSSSSSQKKLQDPPVSVPCGYSPRRNQPRRSQAIGSSSSSNCSNSESRIPADAQKPKPKPKSRTNEHRSPMLASIETSTEKFDKKKKKKGQSCIVEAVDLKCNNPRSSRFKKLGFSKLSESII